MKKRSLRYYFPLLYISKAPVLGYLLFWNITIHRGQFPFKIAPIDQIYCSIGAILCNFPIYIINLFNNI